MIFETSRAASSMSSCSHSRITRHPAFAKINLHLNVGGVRPDGFHDVQTVLQTIDLFVPPQRERIRAESARLEAEGLQQRQIAHAI